MRRRRHHPLTPDEVHPHADAETPAEPAGRALLVAGLEKTRVFLKTTQPSVFFVFFLFVF
jgi:hypothetical protein